MNVFGPDIGSTPEPAVRCECCGSAAECDVWKHQLCVACAAEWRATSGLDAGEVGLELPHAQLCAEYRKRTTAWVTLRRRELTQAGAA